MVGGVKFVDKREERGEERDVDTEGRSNRRGSGLRMAERGG